MSRTICVVTGSRADYGLLRWVMEGVARDPDLELQVAVTGMHLSPEFGLTYRQIETDGFRVDSRVEMLLGSDTPSAIAKSVALGASGFGDALARLRPDLLLVLGDRFEIFAAVTAALFARVPVAHLHGGETTAGSLDDAMRHAITKMSHLHFVAAADYGRRVVQLGEDPRRVFVVGGLGVDTLRRTPLLERAALEASLGISLGAKSLLVTFHPATLERESASRQMEELLAALHELNDTTLIFTMPNADTGGRDLFPIIETFVGSHLNARAFTSLGTVRYLSCMSLVDGLVGNSSSGLLEAPSLRKGSINIGERQTGRLKAESVIDCAPHRVAIQAAIERLFSQAFQATLSTVRSPYGEGGASEMVLDVLRTYPLADLVTKTFHDLPH
jgi:GDP/UDP-N,N'-diacetylbacillosamine 2-epimerase (hydrolysing)